MALMHVPALGFVWQIVSVRGSGALPVSGDTVMSPPAPTLAVATANAPPPASAAAGAPTTSTIPLLSAVAASAMRSGTADVEADSRIVSSPMTTGAGVEPAH